MEFDKIDFIEEGLSKLISNIVDEEKYYFNEIKDNILEIKKENNVDYYNEALKLTKECWGRLYIKEMFGDTLIEHDYLTLAIIFLHSYAISKNDSPYNIRLNHLEFFDDKFPSTEYKYTSLSGFVYQRYISSFVFDKEIKNIRDYDSKFTDLIKLHEDVDSKIKNLAKITDGIKREKEKRTLITSLEELITNKNKENKRNSIFLVLYSTMLILIPFFSLLLEIISKEKLNKMTENMIDISSPLPLTNLIPFISLEIILLYLVRITYQNKKSISAQLIQLNLRVGLSNFINEYIKSRFSEQERRRDDVLLLDIETWRSYEKLIFSPIVTVDEKIPSIIESIPLSSDMLKILSNKTDIKPTPQ